MNKLLNEYLNVPIVLFLSKQRLLAFICCCLILPYHPGSWEATIDDESQRSHGQICSPTTLSWWCHDLKTHSALLALWVSGIHQWTLYSLHRGTAMRGSDFSFVVSLNKLSNKQLTCRWFQKPWPPCNITVIQQQHVIDDKLTRKYIVISKIIHIFQYMPITTIRLSPYTTQFIMIKLLMKHKTGFRFKPWPTKE